MTTAKDLARTNPLLEGVEPEVTRSLLARARHGCYQAHDPIVQGGDGAFGLLFVFSGSVKSFYSSEDGAQVMVRIVRGPEAIAGCPGAFGTEWVQALEPCEALLVGVGDYQAALARSHRLTLNALQAVGSQLAAASNSIRSFAFRGVEGRLADLLISLAREYGARTHDGVRIELPLTQEELADMLGVARRSVTRSFRRFAESGALSKRDGRFIVREARLAAVH